MQAGGASGDSRTFSLSGISLHNLTRLLSNGSSSLYFEGEGEDDDDDEADVYEDDDDWGYEIRTHSRPPWYEEVTEPVKEGVELLYSGDFGRIGPKSRSRRKAANIARRVLAQSSIPTPVSYREELTSVSLIDRYEFYPLICLWKDMVPNSNGTTVAEYASNIYTGQFSTGSGLLTANFQPLLLTLHVLDSSFYYTCAQGKVQNHSTLRKVLIFVRLPFAYLRYKCSSLPSDPAATLLELRG